MSGKYLKSPKTNRHMHTTELEVTACEQEEHRHALITPAGKINIKDKAVCLRDVGAAEYYIIAKRLQSRIRDFI